MPFQCIFNHWILINEMQMQTGGRASIRFGILFYVWYRSPSMCGIVPHLCFRSNQFYSRTPSNPYSKSSALILAIQAAQTRNISIAAHRYGEAG